MWTRKNRLPEYADLVKLSYCLINKGWLSCLWMWIKDRWCHTLYRLKISFTWTIQLTPAPVQRELRRIHGEKKLKEVLKRNGSERQTDEQGMCTGEKQETKRETVRGRAIEGGGEWEQACERGSTIRISSCAYGIVLTPWPLLLLPGNISRPARHYSGLL